MAREKDADLPKRKVNCSYLQRLHAASKADISTKTLRSALLFAF